jgi:hypothetical protein
LHHATSIYSFASAHYRDSFEPPAWHRHQLVRHPRATLEQSRRFQPSVCLQRHPKATSIYYPSASQWIQSRRLFQSWSWLISSYSGFISSCSHSHRTTHWTQAIHSIVHHVRGGYHPSGVFLGFQVRIIGRITRDTNLLGHSNATHPLTVINGPAAGDTIYYPDSNQERFLPRRTSWTKFPILNPTRRSIYLITG